MKDRSRLLSSVIVSLLAGFTYYQIGDDIQSKLSNSIKAVISYNDSEIYGPENCQSFNSIVKKSDVKLIKKSKFYINKKNKIEFKKNDVIIPGDEMLSHIVSQHQANFKKPTPDKNVDFTAELNSLIKSSSSNENDKDFKVEWKRNNKDEGSVADSRLRSNVLMIIKGLGNSDKESKFDENTGYGFEFNYTVDEEKVLMNREYSRIKRENSIRNSNSESNSDSECKCKRKVETKSEKKIEVILPKKDCKVNEEDGEIDLPEINIDHDTSEEDPM